MIRQPPVFPYRHQYSIFGRKGLNLRVRDVYGCFPSPHHHRKLREAEASARRVLDGTGEFILLDPADETHMRRSRERRTVGPEQHLRMLRPGLLFLPLFAVLVIPR